MTFQHGGSGVIAIRPLAALIVGAGAAVVLSLTYRGADVGSEAETDPHLLFEAQPPTQIAERHAPTAAPADARAPAQRALAVPELFSAPESQRNNTLLITIRENGYDCDELMSAQERGDPLGGWRVACRGALAYFVAVGRGGQLVVEPLPLGDYLPGAPPQQLPQNELPNPLRPPNR